MGWSTNCQPLVHAFTSRHSKVVHLRVERSFGEPLPQFGPISSPLLYVEVALVGCPGCPGLDADPYLVYGDTFAIVTERPQLVPTHSCSVIAIKFEKNGEGRGCCVFFCCVLYQCFWFRLGVSRAGL